MEPMGIPGLGSDVCSAKDTTAIKSRSEAAQVAERIRVQELLRYLQPYEATPPLSSKARIATDSTLTAFAQLSALRLNCERSFISLMDNCHQYIVAEATRTVSLKSEDVYDGGDDAIYLGQTILEFEWGVCPGTIACFTSPDDSLNVSTEYVKATRNHYVMNDMSKLDGFKDRPYIAGWPYMKYYAEVPIHSPSGLTIGTLCVVDNKPRDGLDTKGLEILEEISQAVMNHLELCVSKIQRNNAERMIHALGQFVQGNDSVRQWWTEAQSSRIAQPGMRHLSIEERAEIEFGEIVKKGVPTHPSHSTVSQFEALKIAGGARPDTSIDTSARSRSLGSGDLFDAPNWTSNDTAPTATTSVIGTTSPEIPDDKNPEPMYPVVHENPPMSKTATDIEILLARATNLIREGVGLEGVLFLDPRSADGMLLADTNPTSNGMAWPGSEEQILNESSEHFQNTSPLASPAVEANKKYCKVMGSSIQNKAQFGGVPQISEKILQHMLKAFPRGGVLHFDGEGLVGESDKVFIWNDMRRQSTASEHTISIPKDKSIANELRSVLPAATSIMLFPLWDISLDKWFSYSIAWTTNPNRVFQREDFAYFASFGNSVMAEISRLDIVAADQAKAGFISSISHELRSPLHGIMASVELLHDLNYGSVFNETLRTIDSCGSTLLETMDNLLTFAKIHRLSAAKDTSLRVTKRTGGKASSVIDVEALVEDTVQICIASKCFHDSVETPNGSPQRVRSGDDAQVAGTSIPTIICDIQAGVDWVFNTDSAVWKRLLMNLLGNALKYTPSGTVYVRLRQESSADTIQQVTSVQDSTKGSTVSDSNNLYEAVPSSRRVSSSLQGSASQGWPNRSSVIDQANANPPLHSRVGSKPTTIILTVEDSGKGISTDYMAHHLFKPFYQEDAMNPGTGLGLSIVSQLVSSIGGFINVASELGTGTKVTIECPVERPNTAPPSAENVKPFLHSNLKLGIFGLDPVPNLHQVPNGILDSRARRLLAIRSMLSNYAKALGLSVETVYSMGSTVVDVVITTEAEYLGAKKSALFSSALPTIVLADEPTMQYPKLSSEFNPAIVLFQPYGPRMFRKALEAALLIPSRLNKQVVVEPHLDPTFSAIAPLKPDFLLNSQPGLNSKQEQPQLHENDTSSILLVEDNVINLKLLVMSMKRIGQTYETARNGAEAFDAYRRASGKFAVIIMDVQMPVMNGLQASRAIRQWEKEMQLSPTVIIALTALTSMQAEQDALDSGVNQFLSKPISMKKLKEVLGKVLEQ